MKFKEAYAIALPKNKRSEEKFNFWVALVVRPLSILFTIPFLKTSIKPIVITAISILFAIAGGILFGIGRELYVSIIGWICFFIWAILDGVDGNLARIKGLCSKKGELWDTVGGYAAMVLIYFCAGISAFFEKHFYAFCEDYLLIIISGATALLSIFPRLVLHKKKTLFPDSVSASIIADKTKYGLSKIIAMNFVSPSGFMQVILLLCLVFNTLNFFIIFYFIVNLGIASLSLTKLLFSE